MNIKTNKARWFGSLGILLAIAVTSTSAQAASREDVIIGVIAGAAAGYVLSEHGSDLHIGYRQGSHYNDAYARHRHPHFAKHKHYGKHCNHKSHRSGFYSDRRHTQFNSHWANQRHYSKHHSQYFDKHYKKDHGKDHRKDRGKHRDGHRHH